MAFDVMVLEQAGPPVLLTVRGHKVVLGMDVARLFGIEHKRLNEQVLRNGERFDADFAFRLTSAEFTGLRSHFATTNEEGGRGGNRVENRARHRGQQTHRPGVCGGAPCCR